MNNDGWRNPSTLITFGALMGGILVWFIGATIQGIIKDAGPEQWLGFAGSALSCIFTLISITVAFFALRQQQRQVTIPHLWNELARIDDELPDLKSSVEYFSEVYFAIRSAEDVEKSRQRVLLMAGISMINSDGKSSIINYIRDRFPKLEYNTSKNIAFALGELRDIEKRSRTIDNDDVLLGLRMQVVNMIDITKKNISEYQVRQEARRNILKNEIDKITTDLTKF